MIVKVSAGCRGTHSIYLDHAEDHDELRVVSGSGLAVTAPGEDGTITAVIFHPDSICRGVVLVNDNPFDGAKPSLGDRITFIKNPYVADELRVPVGVVAG